jgi:peptidoglycan/xylan/chitin deacetylase (PgdA/CDA1 family)
MLFLLRKLRVTKATFFLTGKWTQLHPHIAKRIHRMGYEIASHGHQHDNYSSHTNTWIEQDVYTSRKSIYNATGVMTNVIRTPSGDLNNRVIKKLLKMNQTIVHWSIDSLDWKLTNVFDIVRRVNSKAHPGGIVLLHACDLWPQSLKAVPLIIEGLRKKGYRFVTIRELLTDHK